MKYRPMLAELGEGPFDSPEWAFEPKWDGLRAIAHVEGGKAHLVSRSGRDITPQFPEVAIRVAGDAVLDGEMVVLDAAGRPDFPAISGRAHLQNPLVIGLRARLTQPALYLPFDILEFKGCPLVRESLAARRETLVAVVAETGSVRLTPQVVGQGTGLFESIRARGMEGIMAKRLTAPYQPGVRSRDWLKVKVSREGEFWVVGVTQGEGRRQGLLGALVLAEASPQGLVPVGEVGTGFTDDDLVTLTRVLQEVKREWPAAAVSVDRLWFWTQPTFKVKVSYLEKTGDGRLRFPSYKGRLV